MGGMTTTTEILASPARLLPGPGKQSVTLRVDRLIGQSDMFIRFIDPIGDYDGDASTEQMVADVLLASWTDSRWGRPLTCVDDTYRAIVRANEANLEAGHVDRVLIHVDGICVLDEDAAFALDVIEGWR